MYRKAVRQHVTQAADAKPGSAQRGLQEPVRDVFDGTVPAGWEPTLKVSVVTAAFNSATLPLTLPPSLHRTISSICSRSSW